MKILQVMAGNTHGGAETAFVDMCVAVKKTGKEVEVVTRDNPVRIPLLEEAGLKVHKLPFRGAVDIFTPMVMKKIIRKTQPDIVQTWMSRGAQKTPHWQQVQTPKRYYTVARLGGYYKIKNFKTMDYFVTITPDLKRHVMDGGIQAERIRHINNFAETEEETVPVSRESLNTPENAIVILTLARLHPNKALDVAIEALKDLPNVYLWLAGEGPIRSELEAQAEAMGVKDRVRFLGWRTDRAALLQAADICAFISRIEPFGTVFAQSWANKTPVIVSDADGPRQFCRDGEDCLMVPKNDVGAFVGAVQRLLDDKVLQMNLVKNGYDRYLNEFTEEKSVQAYLDFYEEILAAPQAMQDINEKAGQ
jgi:glycosyltransferase involved in cell wall biosynthesis